MLKRAFFNVVVDDLDSARGFYTRLFDFEVSFESEWFVQLASASSPSLGIGFLKEGHELVSKIDPGDVHGGLLTLVVEDADAIHEAAKKAGYEILEPPRDHFYGQRRMLLKDPHGLVVDVSSECRPDPDWVARLRPAPGGGYIEDMPLDVAEADEVERDT